MSPRFVLGRENVPCVAEVVNRSLKADCTDFITQYISLRGTAVKEFYRMIRMGVAGHVRGNE